MVTLQLGNSVAVCEFAMVNWSTLNPGSIDGTTQCDVMNAEPADMPEATVAGPTNSATNSSAGSQNLEPAQHLRR
jgi:hypothetical protein